MDFICENLSGDIDIINADNFKKKYTELVELQSKGIIFDCTQLDFVDSTGLSAFVAITKTAISKGLKIKLKNLKSNIAKLFKITKLDNIIDIEEV